jgi:dTDP-4-dehydrorhamnose 3,5-epimerase
MPFQFQPTELDGVIVVEPRAFGDDRGYFLETYKESAFRDAGIRETFVQDNHSRSTRGVLPGLHYQLPPHAQRKLVRVVAGHVWDVAVDLRRSSETFGKRVGFELSETDHRMLYIPPGFGHGFVVLSEAAHLVYKCTAEYNKDAERGVRWDDPSIAVEWPLTDVLVSDKDQALPLLQDEEVFE